MMKSAVILVSLFVTGEPLMRAVRGDPSTSVPLCYGGSGSGETVDVRMDSFAAETGTIDRTGSSLGSISKQWAGYHPGLERLR